MGKAVEVLCPWNDTEATVINPAQVRVKHASCLLQHGFYPALQWIHACGVVLPRINNSMATHLRSTAMRGYLARLMSGFFNGCLRAGWCSD